MPKALPPDKVASIRRLFRPGHGPALARTLGVSVSSVYVHARKAHGAGVTSKQAGPSRSARARAIREATQIAGRLHARGMRHKAIAELTGWHPITVGNRIRRYYRELGVDGWQRHGPPPGKPKRPRPYDAAGATLTIHPAT